MNTSLLFHRIMPPGQTSAQAVLSRQMKLARLKANQQFDCAGFWKVMHFFFIVVNEQSSCVLVARVLLITLTGEGNPGQVDQTQN
jgi:hypothetical protein